MSCHFMYTYTMMFLSIFFFISIGKTTQSYQQPVSFGTEFSSGIFDIASTRQRIQNECDKKTIT